jgi:IclR family transcriptional regulator, KDG regulon repressor
MGRQVPALARGLDVLERLAGARGPMTAGELTEALALPRTTAHELLQTLVERGFVEAVEDTPRRYRLGLRLFELGNAYAAGLDLPREAATVAAEVSAACRETVHVAVRDGADVVYVAKADSTHSVRMVSALGGRLPGHLTAVGKLLLAALPDSELARLYPPGRELATMTAASLRTPAALRRELVRVRAEGLAFDRCESNPDVNCVAAAVRDHRGATVAALSVSVPILRWSDEREAELAELARAGAARLSLRLGGVPGPIAHGIRDRTGARLPA